MFFAYVFLPSNTTGNRLVPSVHRSSHHLPPRVQSLAPALPYPCHHPLLMPHPTTVPKRLQTRLVHPSWAPSSTPSTSWIMLCTQTASAISNLPPPALFPASAQSSQPLNASPESPPISNFIPPLLRRGSISLRNLPNWSPNREKLRATSPRTATRKSFANGTRMPKK